MTPAAPPPGDDLQALCEAGQRALVATDYLSAIDHLEHAQAGALAASDFDTLGRLLFPLQEARRQKRHLAGEGVALLDVLPTPDGDPDPAALLDAHPHGQFLVAGLASVTPGVTLRRLARERRLFAQTYLAAAWPAGAGGQMLIAVVPTDDVALPPRETALRHGVDGLVRRLPPFCVTLFAADLPRGPRPGSTESFARTMDLWERLHLPFLTAARDMPDPRRRLEGYCETIRVDEACEKAHQWASDTAMVLARTSAAGGTGVATRLV